MEALPDRIDEPEGVPRVKQECNEQHESAAMKTRSDTDETPRSEPVEEPEQLSDVKQEDDDSVCDSDGSTTEVDEGNNKGQGHGKSKESNVFITVCN